MTITLDLLKQNKAVPMDLQVVKNIHESCITLDEFQSLPLDSKLSNKKPIVLNNPIWVAISSSTRIVFSCDGFQVGKLTSKGKQLCIQNFLEKEGKLATIKFIELFERKDEKRMENLTGLQGLDINSLASEIQNEQKAGAPQQMTAFTAETEGEENKGASDLAARYISANIDNVRLADTTDLSIFNRKHGEFVGYITMNDSLVKFTTNSVPRTVGGKKVVLANTPQELKAKNEQGESIPKEWYEKDVVLAVKQAAPGKVLGGVVGVPVGGFVSFSDFREAESVKFDKSNTTLKYGVFDKDQLNTVLSFYFNNRIREAEATHGAGGHLTLKVRQSVKKATADSAEVVYIRPRLEPENRKSAIIATNYFPVKVYETLDPYSNLTPAQFETLNESSFIHLFESSSTRAGSVPKIQALAAKDQNRVRMGANKKIESVFFTTNAGERQQLEVKAFFDKAVNLNAIAVPLKKSTPKKEGTGLIWRYVTFSSVAKEVNENQDYRAKTSLYSGRFKHIIDACQGAINEESLKALTRKTNKDKGTTNTLTSEQTRALLFKNMQSGLDGVKFEGATKRPTYENFSELIAEVRG